MKTHSLTAYFHAIYNFVISKLHDRAVLVKFLLVSGSAVVINLALLYLLVAYLHFDSPAGENIANVLSMEIAIIYNFFMSRAITWQDRVRESGWRLLLQVLKFHITIGITIVLRIVLFFLLQMAGLHYLINAAIGIALAAAINFVVYDTLIFKKKGDLTNV